MINHDIKLLFGGIFMVIPLGAVGFNINTQSPFLNSDVVQVFSSVGNILNPMFVSNGESAMRDRTIAAIGKAQRRQFGSLRLFDEFYSFSDLFVSSLDD